MASKRTRARVHEAALSLVGDAGIAKVTMEGIAARAGVGKQTLYRTWPSTSTILFDALLARSETSEGVVDVPDSGDLRSDLLLLVHQTIQELTSPATEPLLRVVTAAIQTDSELARQYGELLLEPQMSAVTQRLTRGGVTEPDAAAELLLGPILHRWLLRRGAFDHGWMEDHVDRTLRGVGATDQMSWNSRRVAQLSAVLGEFPHWGADEGVRGDSLLIEDRDQPVDPVTS